VLWSIEELSLLRIASKSIGVFIKYNLIKEIAYLWRIPGKYCWALVIIFSRELYIFLEASCIILPLRSIIQIILSFWLSTC
jgi:hypothetical protein